MDKGAILPAERPIECNRHAYSQGNADAILAMNVEGMQYAVVHYNRQYSIRHSKPHPALTDDCRSYWAGYHNAIDTKLPPVYTPPVK